MRSSERRRSRAGTSASVKARKRRVSRSLISDSMLSGGCAGNACATSSVIETLKKIARFIQVLLSRTGHTCYSWKNQSISRQCAKGASLPTQEFVEDSAPKERYNLAQVGSPRHCSRGVSALKGPQNIASGKRPTGTGPRPGSDPESSVADIDWVAVAVEKG